MSAMPNPLRVALIGLGAVAVQRHLPVLTQHPNFQIVVAADIDAARAARVAAQFSLPRVLADARAAIESENVDVVAITTPPLTHAELAHAALDAGKHIFLEKPFTLDVAQGQALAAHAERATTKLLVGFNQRQHAQIQHARQVVQQGHLGTLRAASTLLANSYRRTVKSAWYQSTAHGGDLFFELGVHHFDALRYILDAEPLQVYADEALSPHNSVTALAHTRFSNGLLAATTLVEDAVEHNALEFIGERGRLLVSPYRYDGLRFIPRGSFDGAFGLRLREQRNALMQLPAALSRLRRGGDYVLTYRAEWDHLFAVIQNDLPPGASARDGLQATRMARAARDSVNTRAPIALA